MLHPQGSPNIPIRESFALNPGNLRGGGLNSKLITWPISSLKSLSLWLRAGPGLPCSQQLFTRLLTRGEPSATRYHWEDSLLPAHWAGPLPGVPEILIFFTVLLVLLVT